MKKKYRITKQDLNSGAEYRRLNENLIIMYHLYKNVMSYDLLRRG